jgi:hypothetical protein
MKKVSDNVQDVFSQLVAWECLGMPEVDPKILLRQVSLGDLSIVSSNIKSQGSALKEFVCCSMVGLEILYRTGMLVGDWSFTRDGEKVRLSYEPMNFPRGTYDINLLSVGAHA